MKKIVVSSPSSSCQKCVQIFSEKRTENVGNGSLKFESQFESRVIGVESSYFVQTTRAGA